VITKIAGGQALTPTELQDALSIAVGKLPGLGESEEGFLALPELGFVMRRGRLSVSVKGTGAFGIDPVLDLTNLSLSDDLDALTQVSNVVGTGNDRSGAFTNSGSQALADTIAGFAAWSQNQAEELVYQAEQAGLNTSVTSVQTLISNIAADTGGLTAGDLSQNGSGALVRGLFTQEVGLGYAHPLLGNRLGIGGNARYVRGVTTSKFIQYDDVKDGVDLIGEITDFESEETTQTVTADLGVLFRPNYRWRFGIVGRNLTSPKFDLAGPGSYEIEPQVRAGVALNVLPTWVLAMDVDLTENESSAIPDYTSRLVSVGSEYVIGLGETALALRAGAYTNLAQDPQDSMTFTAGMGFRLGQFQFDLAVAGSPELEELDAADVKIPSRLRVSGALRWVTSL
jgi:hypothetical protein